MRERNESAWLLPNDGTRTNHRLRARHAPVRRHRRGRPGHRRLRRRRLGAAAAAGPGRLAGGRAGRRARSGTRTGTGSATRPGRTTCTGPSRGSSPAPTRCRWARTTPAAASAARWCTTPATRRASTPATSDTCTADGVGADWPISLRRPAALLRADRAGAAGRRASTGRGATRTATRTGRTRSAATARSSCAARARLGIDGQGRAGRHRQRAVRQPAALHLPRLLPAGLQGQRQGLAADHPHPGRAGPRRRDPRRLHGDPHRDRRANRPGHRRALRPRRRASGSSGPRMVAVAGYSIETPRLLLNSACRALPGRAVQRLRPGRPLPDGAGRAADRGPVRRRGADVQGAAARGQHARQFYETDPAKPYKRGFSIQTVSPLPITWAEHVAAQGHWGAALREYMSDYVHWAMPRRAVRVPAPARQPGHAGRREGPARPAGRQLLLLPVRQRPQLMAQAAADGDGGHPARRRAPTRSSPSTATPTWSAAPGWPPTSGTAWSTRDCRSFAVPNLYITDGSVLPTQGSANPALTIMAVAARAADHLAAGARGGSSVMTSDPAIESVETARVHGPDRRARGRRHPRLGRTTLVLARVRAGGHRGDRLDLRLGRLGRGHHPRADPGGAGPSRAGRARQLRGHGPGRPQRRPAGRGRLRHLRGRHRAVGPQGQAARPAVVPAAGRGPRRGPGLRQRRLHPLRRRPAPVPS